MFFAFFSPQDMLVVMAVALIVFGPKRLPEVGRQLGGFVRDMRKTMGQFTDTFEDAHREFRTVLHDSDPPAAATPWGKPTTNDSEPESSNLMRPYDQREPFISGHNLKSASADPLEPGHPSLSNSDSDIESPIRAATVTEAGTQPQQNTAAHDSGTHAAV